MRLMIILFIIIVRFCYADDSIPKKKPLPSALTLLIEMHALLDETVEVNELGNSTYAVKVLNANDVVLELFNCEWVENRLLLVGECKYFYPSGGIFSVVNYGKLGQLQGAHIIFLPSGRVLSIGHYEQGKRYAGSFFEGVHIAIDADIPSGVTYEPADAKISFYAKGNKIGDYMIDEMDSPREKQ